MASNKSSPLESPPILAVVLVIIVMVFATLGWFGSRAVLARIYGVVRSIQLPYFDQFIPYANRFDPANLHRGVVPEFTSIYQNSLYYGLFMTMLTFIVMLVALGRLSKNDIKGVVQIKRTTGRSYDEVLNAYAKIEPSVGFFKDYSVLDLPTNIGTARQNYTAMEMLFYTGALLGVVQNTVDGRPPYLDIDKPILKDWLIGRFGPKNPFYGMSNDKLSDVDAIKAAVDKLGWAETLVLYPSILRIYGFHVEKEGEGFKANNDTVDDFISDTWREMNRFKAVYGDGVELGFADLNDREEREERFKRITKKKTKLNAKDRAVARTAAKDQQKTIKAAEKAQIDAEVILVEVEAGIQSLRSEMENADPEHRADISTKIGELQDKMQMAIDSRDAALRLLNGAATKAFTSTRSISMHEIIYLMGEAERSIDHKAYQSALLSDDEILNFNLNKPNKIKKPAELQFFGEVLSLYAEKGYLKCVKIAREKLKELLTRHLTERTGNYPVMVGKDGRIVFQGSVNDKEEQAFNHKAQLWLNDYAKAVEKVLMNHAYQFGAVGGALTEARKSGILPPNNFRWMRFCTETEALWWFVHNLGMPSAVPENSGMFEHYQIEVAAKSGISKPFVAQALDGMKEEAERYLTRDMIDEIKSILGNNAVIDEMVKRGRLEQEAMDRSDQASPIGETALEQIVKKTEKKEADKGAKHQLDGSTNGKELEDVFGKAPGSSIDPDDLDDFFN